MKLNDVIQIEEVPSQALVDNNSRDDLVNMPFDEVKHMESDLRVELGLLKRLAQYMPSALNAWRLDSSQIEEIEKPKKELQELLSLVMQHQGSPIIGVRPVAKAKSKRSNKCNIS